MSAGFRPSELVVIVLLTFLSFSSPLTPSILRLPPLPEAAARPPLDEGVGAGRQEFLSTLQPKQHLIPDSVSGTDREPSRVKHLPRILCHPSLLLLFTLLICASTLPLPPTPSPCPICLSAGGYKLCIGVYTRLTDADVSRSYGPSSPL